MSNTEAMRKAFEAWHSSQDQAEPETERVYEFSEDGMNELIKEVMFEAWQAATAQATAGMKDRLLAALERAAAAETSLHLQATAAQWICIDERMPINGERVLALGIYPDYPPQGADTYTAIFNDVYEVFELNPSPHEDEYDTVQLSAVTHWQPRPPKPLRKGEALEGEQ